VFAKLLEEFKAMDEKLRQWEEAKNRREALASSG